MCLYDVYSWPIDLTAVYLRIWDPTFLSALSNDEVQSQCSIQFMLQIRGPHMMNPMEGTKCVRNLQLGRLQWKARITPRCMQLFQPTNAAAPPFNLCMPNSISNPICMGARSRVPNARSNGPYLMMQKGRAYIEPPKTTGLYDPSTQYVNARCWHHGPRRKKLQNGGILLVESKHLDHKEFSLESGSKAKKKEEGGDDVASLSCQILVVFIHSLLWENASFYSEEIEVHWGRWILNGLLFLLL